MVKKCKEENCNKQSVFNFINEKYGIYCKIHKKEKIPSRASSSSLRSRVLSEAYN